LSPPWKVIGRVTKVHGKVVTRIEAPPPAHRLAPYAGKIAP
jgi:hypothetical protein